MTLYLGSPLEIPNLDIEERKGYKHSLLESKQQESLLSSTLYASIQRKCFNEVHSLVFRPFRKLPDYSSMIDFIQASYNKVTVDDFDYIRKLGEGGFGLVVHCVKKSTGNHHAMKIQLKRGLIELYTHKVTKT